MVFTKLFFYHPYTISVEIPANSWTTPKSLAHAIALALCVLPHGSCGDTILRHFVTQMLLLYSQSKRKRSNE